MQTDTITRVLLVAILLCLVVLIVLNFGSDESAPPVPVTSADAATDVEGGATYRNQRGRVLEDSDLVVLMQTVGNEALPSDMRVWAALQLQGVMHDQVREALVAELDAEDLVLSTAALQALAGHDDPRVREAARRGLEHEDEDVRIISSYVLESLEGKGAESP